MILVRDIWNRKKKPRTVTNKCQWHLTEEDSNPLTPIKFGFQQDSFIVIMALISPSLYFYVCSFDILLWCDYIPRLELNWVIIIPHKTWEGEKTLCQGNISVLDSKSSGLLVWLFLLPYNGYVLVCHKSGEHRLLDDLQSSWDDQVKWQVIYCKIQQT